MNYVVRTNRSAFLRLTGKILCLQKLRFVSVKQDIIYVNRFEIVLALGFHLGF